MTQQEKASLKVNEILLSSDSLDSSEDQGMSPGVWSVQCPHCGMDIYDDDVFYDSDEWSDAYGRIESGIFSDPTQYF